ncbi:MAG: DUF362 domain-containing protein [Halobacteriota archaeon]|nr:DUF362 domain-containing protein [Halobacteriota archaeon]
MEKSKVALVRCESYDEGEVQKAVEEGIGLLGGIASFIEANEKIVIKPNLLFGAKPEKCVNPHPSIFKALGNLLIEAGAEVYCGDSPGFGRCERQMERAGLKQVADELGIKLADFDNGRPVSHKDALLNKRFVIANGVLDSDGLINLSKLKTHQLTRLTGAIKNQFGCVPGVRKGEHHVKMPDPYDFSKMLIDLNTLTKARLYIMDAVIAMEGNGPRSGDPKRLNALLFSSDPIALDSVACKIVDLDAEVIPTSKIGEKAGLGTYHYENIEIVGDEVESFVDKSFNIIRKAPRSFKGGRLRAFIRNRVSPRPVINDEKCDICGTCVKMCPVDPKSVNWHTGDKKIPPTYKYDRCIRCYCCQELCPEGAITVENTLLGRVAERILLR